MWLLGMCFTHATPLDFKSLYFCVIFVSCFFKYPNLKIVRELIYKRGYGKLNKNMIALTDNSVIGHVSLFLSLIMEELIMTTIILFITCLCDHRLWANMVLSALKILFMRSWQWDLILSKLTTSSGHLSWRYHWVGWRRRGTITSKEEMLKTMKITSTSLSGEWTRLTVII